MKRLRPWHLAIVAVIACVFVASPARAAPLTTINTEIDIIPFLDSVETQQNSEPSIAVNPLNPMQMIAGSFTGEFNCVFNCSRFTVTTPYFASTNGGTIWSDFGSLQTIDKSIAWKQDGSAALNTTLSPSNPLFNNQISTFSNTIADGSFTTNINIFNPGQNLDQPWVRTGPSTPANPNPVYVGYNNLSAPGGRTASVNVSTNGGLTYTTKVIETVNPGAGQDAPSIREAVNGDTVYAVFTRWDSVASTTGGGTRYNATEVVVKSTNGGASFSAGTVPAGLISPFTNCPSTGCTVDSAVSLGAERVGSDNAIAVGPAASGPNGPGRVVVAYVDSPALGQMQVVVSESTDGGTGWKEKFRTPTATRSAQPALTILDDGQIVLLFNNYNPATDKLSQHLVATSDDFVTATDTILATESNDTSMGPTLQFSPYVGDFFDLTSIGNTFYGIFSASNDDDGTLASFLNTGPSLFQRCNNGKVGMPGFELNGLKSTDGIMVCDPTTMIPFSIDPIFFSGTSIPAPEPGTVALLGTSLLGLAVLRRRRKEGLD